MHDHQWRAALVLANAQRKGAVVLRERLIAGRMTMHQALGDPCAARLPVYRVIRWQPRWGQKRTEDLLAELEIWPNRPCGQLSPRERQLLGHRVR